LAGQQDPNQALLKSIISKDGAIISEFEHKVTESVLIDLLKIADLKTITPIEQYLNYCGTSLSKICKNPEIVSYVLHCLFGEGVSLFIDRMAAAAFQSYGLKFDEKYSRNVNLPDAISHLKSLVETERSES